MECPVSFSKGVVFGARYLNSAIAGRSSVFHFSSAASAAPLMALPAMKVMREAETEPEFPMVAVSDVSICTLSALTPTASAAICAMTVCVPCPTSAPAWCTITFSILPVPVDLHFGPAIFLIAKTKSHVFESRRKPASPHKMPGCGFLFLICVPTEFCGCLLHDLDDGHRTRGGGAHARAYRHPSAHSSGEVPADPCPVFRRVCPSAVQPCRGLAARRKPRNAAPGTLFV